MMAVAAQPETYPETRTAEIHTGVDRHETIGESGALHGGDVLPGFALPLKKLFARAGRRPPRNRASRPRNGRKPPGKGKGRGKR